MAYLRRERGCEVVGVEIVEGAERVQDAPFRGSTAFMLGNEGAGLTEKQIGLCASCTSRSTARARRR